jgi:hypothetical protein
MVELQFLRADRADIDAYRTQPFKNLLQNQRAKFNQTWYKLSLGIIWFLQIKGQVLIKGEIITKIGWGHLKIFFRTTGPILTRLGKDHL